MTEEEYVATLVIQQNTSIVETVIEKEYVALLPDRVN